MTQEQIESLALKRATEILESWWYEMPWEWAEENEITDEEMEKVLAVPFDVFITE